MVVYTLRRGLDEFNRLDLGLYGESCSASKPWYNYLPWGSYSHLDFSSIAVELKLLSKVPGRGFLTPSWPA